MRKLLLSTWLACFLVSNIGCVIPIYSPNHTRRMTQLLNSSENLRMITDEWERIWLLDMPNHMTPHRVHGGM